LLALLLRIRLTQADQPARFVDWHKILFLGEQISVALRNADFR
jgi:hypothetical protein